MDLTGKVCVVTGAGSGIGRQLVVELVARGASVAGVDYDEASLLETKACLPDDGAGMSTHVLDVTDAECVFALPERIVSIYGGVQLVINNAGVVHSFKGILDLPVEQVERVFNVNWWGTYYVTKAFLPHLRSEVGSGLVNVSSMGGFMPFPEQTAYGASKSAVKLLTEGLRVELEGQSDMLVSLVFPGAVNTGIALNSPDVDEDFKSLVRSQEGEKQFGVSAERAAKKIVRGIEKNQSRILIGADSFILDKLYRLAPLTSSSVISRLILKAKSASISKITNSSSEAR